MTVGHKKATILCIVHVASYMLRISGPDMHIISYKIKTMHVCVSYLVLVSGCFEKVIEILLPEFVIPVVQ